MLPPRCSVLSGLSWSVSGSIRLAPTSHNQKTASMHKLRFAELQFRCAAHSRKLQCPHAAITSLHTFQLRYTCRLILIIRPSTSFMFRRAVFYRHINKKGIIVTSERRHCDTLCVRNIKSYRQKTLPAAPPAQSICDITPFRHTWRRQTPPACRGSRPGNHPCAPFFPIRFRSGRS